MDSLFSFGKKRRSRKSKKTNRKPPVKILRLCRRLKIKCTKKVGKRRVYKSLAVLKKQIKRKMKKTKRKVRRTTRFRFSFGSTRRTRSRFGSPGDFTNAGPSGYGYNQKAMSNPGILSQTSQVVTRESNASRPSSMQLDSKYIPTYGVNKKFFTADIPSVLGPEWYAMGQPDGTLVPVGSPFYRNTSAYGRRRRRRYGFGNVTQQQMKMPMSYTAKVKQQMDAAKKHGGILIPPSSLSPAVRARLGL